MSKRKASKRRRRKKQKEKFSLFTALSKILKQWWHEKHPVLVFSGRFILIITLFHILRYTAFYSDRIHPSVIHSNAEGGNWFLNMFGFETRAEAGAVISSSFHMNINHGCDAVDAIIILTAIVLAFPTRWSKKLIGAFVGLLFLVVLNLIRIISLFWLGEQHPAWFEFAHVELWQFLFIIMTLAFCALWIRWSLVGDFQKLKPA